jgi:sulfite reductase (NADPH) hemoprotein beta-component
VSDFEDRKILEGLRAIAHVHKGNLRLTPNQNAVIAGVDEEDKPKIDALLEQYGLSDSNVASAMRLNSIACVALPTCGLAMAEAERYMPDFLTKLEEILAANGLTDDPITIRISGCPNGCARPYVAEIALTGRAPGKYNLYVGGGFHGERLNTMIRENIGEAAILELLGEQLGRYAKERTEGERFGDFLHRVGGVESVAA